MRAGAHRIRENDTENEDQCGKIVQRNQLSCISRTYCHVYQQTTNNLASLPNYTFLLSQLASISVTDKITKFVSLDNILTFFHSWLLLNTVADRIIIHHDF